jgi:hypothetical protein
MFTISFNNYANLQNNYLSNWYNWGINNFKENIAILVQKIIVSTNISKTPESKDKVEQPFLHIDIHRLNHNLQY